MKTVKGQFFLYMAFLKVYSTPKPVFYFVILLNGLPKGSFSFFVMKLIDADGVMLLSCKKRSRESLSGADFRRNIILKRLSKVLAAISVAVITAVPAMAEGLDGIVGADFGGIESLLMATLLLAFGFFMRKFW